MDARQQAALIELGQLALTAPEPASLLQRAAELVANTLDVPYSAIWEGLPDQRSLLLRAGAGWREKALGQVTLGAIPLADALLRDTASVVVVSRDSCPIFGQIPALRDQRLMSGLWASIPGPDRPFGAVCAYSPTDRAFADGEAQFLQMAAHTLGMAMARARTESALRLSEERFQRLAENASDLINKRKRLEAELAEAHRRLVDSRETARLFLARELHDSAVQQLLGVSYQLAAYRRHASVLQPAGRGGAEEDIAEILATVRQSILHVVQQIRLLIGELRPAGLEEFGLTTALRGYVSHLAREERRTAARISLDLVETGTDMPRLTGVCLFRVGQEALRNALKHAAARHIHVSLCRSAETIVLRVNDDGRGFHVPEQLSELALDDHFGLVGMAEWVASVQGKLSIQSRLGAGTQVEAMIPLACPRPNAAGRESDDTGV